jgi:hypothetical protein
VKLVSVSFRSKSGTMTDSAADTEPPPCKKMRPLNGSYVEVYRVPKL